MREEVERPKLPNNPISGNTVQEEANKELREGISTEISRELNVTVQAPQCISEAIQPDKFSKLIRVTALVLKLIKRVRRSPGTCPDIAVDEVNAAKILWYKNIQTQLEEREK